jgi:hypothetical protein
VVCSSHSDVDSDDYVHGDAGPDFDPDAEGHGQPDRDVHRHALPDGDADAGLLADDLACPKQDPDAHGHT